MSKAEWKQAIIDAAMAYADAYVELQCYGEHDHLIQHQQSLRDLRSAIDSALMGRAEQALDAARWRETLAQAGDDSGELLKAVDKAIAARPLKSPTIFFHGQPVGPKCAQAHNFFTGPARKHAKRQPARQAAKVERDEQTLDLFGDE